MNKYLCLLFTLQLFACAKNATPSHQVAMPAQTDTEDDNQDLIIGGRIVTKKSGIASTTVSLLDTEQGTLCTASIVAENIALTAAHCASGNPASMELSFGPRTSNHTTRPVESVAVNPRWKRSQNNETNTGDIALIKFSGGLPSGFEKATMMANTHKLANGEIVTLAGYGITDGESQAGAGILRTVDVKIADANYSKTEVMLDQTEGKGACHGDSGGPAFIQDSNGGLRLWGVTSRGVNDPTDSCSGDSIYTRILPYSLWINSTVKSWR